MFLNIIYSSYSFEIYHNVIMLYFRHCYKSKSHIPNINLVYHFKTCIMIAFGVGCDVTTPPKWHLWDASNFLT